MIYYPPARISGVYQPPMERLIALELDGQDELGDASVPFNFDVHAMIFSDNAPALEAALHRAIDSKKLNMVNTRREFFNVTLDEIEAEVRKNYDKTVEFVRIADAEQYRTSLKIRQEAEKQSKIQSERRHTEERQKSPEGSPRYPGALYGTDVLAP